MKKFWKKAASWAGIVCGAVIMAAAFLLGDRVPQGVGGLLFGGAGMLLGLGCTGVFLDAAWRRMSEEERREVERGERDERNTAIREKAAYASWYWTLYLLWGAFVVTLVMGSGFPTALVSVVIVLHCVFLMVNMNRWARRM